MALVKYNNNSLSSVTSAASFPAGAMTLIKTLTASASATLSFVNGSSDVVLDSTYPIYLFKFINVSPTSGASNPTFGFNGSDDTSSHSYDIVKTTTAIQAYHKEDGSAASLFYNTSFDLAQSTAFQYLNFGDANTDADASGSGELYLFNPSSTTFVKHFIGRTNTYESTNNSWGGFLAGYGNTTSAINALQFQMSSGNIDSGTFKLYGVS